MWTGTVTRQDGRWSEREPTRTCGDQPADGGDLGRRSAALGVWVRRGLGLWPGAATEPGAGPGALRLGGTSGSGPGGLAVRGRAGPVATAWAGAGVRTDRARGSGVPGWRGVGFRGGGARGFGPTGCRVPGWQGVGFRTDRVPGSGWQGVGFRGGGARGFGPTRRRVPGWRGARLAVRGLGGGSGSGVRLLGGAWGG